VIIVENFPNMEKEIANQVQEAQRVPYRINPRRNAPRHILIKLTKTKHKERILKAAREKQQVTYKGNPISLTDDLSAETLQARREWQDIFKVLKGKKSTTKISVRFLIIFSIIILNSFPGNFPISSIFIWASVFLVCSFICVVFLCLFFFF